MRLNPDTHEHVGGGVEEAEVDGEESILRDVNWSGEE